MSDPTSCRSCGASLAPGADRCALCGTPVGAVDPLAPEAIGTETAGATAPVASGAVLVCATCAHPNPPGALFCNQCASPLAEALTAREAVLPAASPEAATGERPPSDVGKRAATFIGVAIAAVVGLYALTAFFGGRGVELEPEPNTEQVPAGVEGVADATMNPLPTGPVPPLPTAALQQQAAAQEAQGTADGFYEAARYYLTAAFQSQQETPEASRLWASRAVALLEQSLEQEDAPDVRIALAEALVFEGVNPMRPIQEAQAVLATDEGHPGANLFIGQRRLMIGRTDQAREAFETVIANTQPGDEARRSAESALELIEGGAIPGVN